MKVLWNLNGCPPTVNQIWRLTKMEYEQALILDNCLRQYVGKGKTLEDERGIWNQVVLYCCNYGTVGLTSFTRDRDADAF